MKINSPKNNRNIIYIMPRQTGKTTKAINMFMKDPESTAFFVENNDMKNFIKSRISYQFHKNIFHKSQNMISRRFKNIIIDDLQKYNYETFRDIIPCLISDKGNITIYTTSTNFQDNIIEGLKFKIVDKTKESLKEQIRMLKYIDSQNMVTNYKQTIQEDILDMYQKIMRTKNINLNYLLK